MSVFAVYKTLPRLTDSLPLIFLNHVLICLDVRVHPDQINFKRSLAVH
jgi:hypothetical protein